MSNQQPTPPGPNTFVLFVFGIILLLPGLCSLSFGLNSSGFLGPWVIGLLIGAGGVTLIAFAIRGVFADRRRRGI